MKKNLLVGFIILVFFLLSLFPKSLFVSNAYAVCSEGEDQNHNIITKQMLEQNPSREKNIVKCLKINTAIGNISTEPAGFVRSIFSLVLGIAGGIALVLIILSGYRFMASQGNPEAVQASRDQLISAIVGLLFIIFSFVILQVIGVNILRIPGFAP